MHHLREGAEVCLERAGPNSQTWMCRRMAGLRSSSRSCSPLTSCCLLAELCQHCPLEQRGLGWCVASVILGEVVVVIRTPVPSLLPWEGTGAGRRPCRRSPSCASPLAHAPLSPCSLQSVNFFFSVVFMSCF